ncbi:MAG TPA: class I SAM-dependent rRNA methyltransferase [Williamwhitmania sp.]|nr:class I SAM-dependent rRNA methyltransferase [Williamwhitmania sp.]
MIATIILKRGKEQSLLRFHPWIFSGAIARIEGSPAEGDLVEVFTAENSFIGTGHYQIGSITVRMLTFEPEKFTDNFWHERIVEAIKLRKAIGLMQNSHTNSFRLIHGEGDGLPGLIVDIYDTTAVIQAHTVGMYRNRQIIAESLMAIPEMQLQSVYDKSSTTLPFNAGLNPQDGFLIGELGTSWARENDLHFDIDWAEGQKTGFYIDQRENRMLLERYSAGRNVLNMFCYTGGFSVYALRGKANLVHSVDSSKRAIELTNANVERNFGNASQHKAFAEDAFSFFRKEEEKYNLIVLDPPAFAKHNKVLGNALQGYKRLNTIALSKIQSGGILFTFSCSQVVTKEHFRNTVFTAAAIAGRKVRILHQLSQPADHPINIYHPEGEYLKGLVVYVE